MDDQTMMPLILALVALLVGLAIVMIAVMLLLPTWLGRRRPNQPERPRRVLAEANRTGGPHPKAAVQAMSDGGPSDELLAEAEEVRLEAERLRIEAREVLAVQTEALDRQKASLNA